MNYAKKKVTMDDIAKALGISKNSVSLALHNKAGVGPALRLKIAEAAKDMNYGGSLSDFQRKRKFISVIVPEYLHDDPYFYYDVFWAIEKEAAAKGCIIITSGVSREDEEALALPPLANDDDVELIGFLIVGVISAGYFQKVCALGLPVLTVDIQYNNKLAQRPDGAAAVKPFGCVGSSNFSGGHLAADYLLSKGHKKIGFIGPVYTAQSVYERYCGFNYLLSTQEDPAAPPPGQERPDSYGEVNGAALAHGTEHGFPRRERFDVLGQKGRFGLFDTPESLDPYLRKMKGFPTAWFCAGDRIAVAAMNWLTHNGVKIPDDVSVIGFDDIPIAEMVFPKLTTIHVNRKLMGKLAVDSLVDMGREGSEVYNISLPVALVERDSVKDISKTQI